MNNWKLKKVIHVVRYMIKVTFIFVLQRCEILTHKNCLVLIIANTDFKKLCKK